MSASAVRPEWRWERPHRGDVLAGFSVAFILVPQALAFAEIAGLPAYFGLYAAALPPIIAAFFASSRYLQTGPTAMTSLLTFGALTALTLPGSDEYVKLAILLALVVGVARMLVGAIRAGPIAYLMSRPILIGFTSAAAILIIASQIPTLLGVEAEGERLLTRAWNALTDPGSWDLVGIGLALAAAALIIVDRRYSALFPGVLIAVAAGIVFSEIAGFDGLVIGPVPTGLPPFPGSLPWSDLPSLLVPGTVIALIGFAEAAAISRTYAAIDRERWNPNREFVAQGVANVASALSSGFPVGGSFSRSSIARLAGGRTRWSGAATGLAVLAFLPFAGLIEALPRAILAAIVIVAVARLIQIRAMVRLITVTWGQSVVAWGTFIATLALAPRIDFGVVIGILLAAAVHLRREGLIRVEAIQEGPLLVLRPHGVLYYGSAPRLSETLVDQLAAQPETTRVVVDLERLGRVDYTGAMALKAFLDEAAEAGLETAVANVPQHAMGTLDRSWGEELPRLMWER